MASYKGVFLSVSIHAPWEGCDRIILPLAVRTIVVSIHAPWEGCDKELKERIDSYAVSIHAPWEGCDVHCTASPQGWGVFQFTHPGKGATRQSGRKKYYPTEFQFTHPGKGATIFLHLRRYQLILFQFTHPGKGATGISSKS